jgi:hypothetical protein
MTENVPPKLIITKDITRYPVGCNRHNGFIVDIKKDTSYDIPNDNVIGCFGISKTMSGTIFIPINNLVAAGLAVVQ